MYSWVLEVEKVCSVDEVQLAVVLDGDADGDAGEDAGADADEDAEPE